MAREKPEIVSRCNREFDEDSKTHEAWVKKVDRWYRAWRGVVDSSAKGWRSQVAPPYLLQIAETLTAGLQDPNPKWTVKPRPRMATVEEIETLKAGAKSLEYLLAYQRDIDEMVLKQRTHRLQGVIAGLTVYKTYWNYADQTDTVKTTHYSVDENGFPQETQVEREEIRIIEDNPCVEVVDVRDWIWHEAARDVQSAKRIHHRVWMDFDDMKRLEKQGYYENVDQLKETNDFADVLGERETTLFDVNRTKDKVEVVEHWIDGGKRVVTIGNRNVLLRDRPNPFEHGSYPFIACSPIPDLFRIPGISIVELVEELQGMLWNLQRQRLDNLELVNNAIVLIRDDTLDADNFVFAPGEQWLVPDKDAVTLWQPDVRSTQVSLEAENLLKADLQNIPGASPALQGQSENTAQTATEVSLLTNLAQKRLASEKFQFTAADTEVGQHWIELNKQFMTEPHYVAIVGKDGEEGWQLIHPESFNTGTFSVVIDQADESIIRQERVAEATARFQVALQAVPVMAAIGQQLNMKPFLEDMLSAAGIDDTEKYLAAAPQPAAPALGQPGQPAPPPGAPAGVSAPQATDMNSPSNPFTQSPVGAVQRQLAMAGGPANA